MKQSDLGNSRRFVAAACSAEVLRFMVLDRRKSGSTDEEVSSIAVIQGFRGSMGVDQTIRWNDPKLQ